MDKMFGFIFTQPLHKSLRQMRIATICLLIVSVDIMYKLVAILENASALSPTQTIGAVGAVATAIFATVWKGIDNLSTKHEADD